MLYLIVGIVLGAAFHEFWHELFQKCRTKINQWTAGENANKDGDVVEGEVVEPKTESAGQNKESSQKEAPQS